MRIEAQHSRRRKKRAPDSSGIRPNIKKFGFARTEIDAKLYQVKCRNHNSGKGRQLGLKLARGIEIRQNNKVISLTERQHRPSNPDELACSPDRDVGISTRPTYMSKGNGEKGIKEHVGQAITRS